jgi:hypothetical protein
MKFVHSRPTPFGNDSQSPDLQQFYQFKLNITQKQAQHISLLGYTLLPFLFQIPRQNRSLRVLQ